MHPSFTPLAERLASQIGAFDALTTGCVLALVSVAVVTDLRSHRIPNWLNLAGAAAALLLQTALLGASAGAWHWFTGLAAGLVPFLLLYLLGAVGAGDAKLMAAIGACVGPAAMPMILLGTLLAGGVLAITVMIARRHARRTLQAMFSTLLWMPYTVAPAATARTQTTARLPYAVAIAAGVLLVMTGVL